MYLTLKNDVTLTDECKGLKLIRDLIIYGKISLFDYFHTLDLNEIPIESCDQQCIDDLKKTCQRLMQENPQSDELENIQNYLKKVSFKNKERLNFKQIHYLQNRIRALIRQELKTLSKDLAQKIYRSLSFSFQ